ncbi:MAG: maleylpyruvate isomerase N-terminal domain-containing protein [Candidatus Dormibacteraeota bacterium]|nr:maleylpyruvate isomerase N-terminal domain-containing protein [Candidatus Dormibacteraeota bacterium]
MTKGEFLAELRDGRRQWEAALARVPQERMLEPELPGGWSLKDVIAHVAWSEREMLGMIRKRAFVGSPLWRLDLDARNAAVVEASRGRPLPEIRDEELMLWTELAPALESLSDEDLTDPTRFPPLQELPGVQPWQIFAGGTFRHYRDHIRDVP